MTEELYTYVPWPAFKLFSSVKTSMAKTGRRWENIPLTMTPYLFGSIVDSMPLSADYFECTFTIKRRGYMVMCDIAIVSVKSNIIEMHAQPSGCFYAYIHSIIQVNIQDNKSMTIDLSIHKDGLFWEKIARCY